ncbi:MAG: methyltransferase domain-containing protein [Actinomycetota bacterium]
MPTTWTTDNLRHAAGLFVQGRRPAATVYDSIGPDFFLALDQGWLNLGLWEGDGSDPEEAPIAVRRLVREIATDLPEGGAVLDVGNGLGAQDRLIADVARPERLVALNLTRSQLVAGAGALADAGATPVNADAMRLPFADASFDGVISVEAAFHFPSRVRFFREASRVLRSGGVLTMSDIPTLRMPRGPAEVLAALAQLRVWGLRASAAATPTEIFSAVEETGFVDVRTRLVGDRVIAPALASVRDRLERADGDAPTAHVLASRVLLGQVELLWRRGMLEYLLLSARKP